MNFLHFLVTFGIVVSITSFFYFFGLPYYFSVIVGSMSALSYSIITKHFDNDGIEDVIGIWVGVILVSIIWIMWVMLK